MSELLSTYPPYEERQGGDVYSGLSGSTGAQNLQHEPGGSANMMTTSPLRPLLTQTDLLPQFEALPQGELTQDFQQLPEELQLHQMRLVDGQNDFDLGMQLSSGLSFAVILDADFMFDPEHQVLTRFALTVCSANASWKTTTYESGEELTVQVPLDYSLASRPAFDVFFEALSFASDTTDDTTVKGVIVVMDADNELQLAGPLEFSVEGELEEHVCKVLLENGQIQLIPTGHQAGVAGQVPVPSFTSLITSESVPELLTGDTFESTICDLASQGARAHGANGLNDDNEFPSLAAGADGGVGNAVRAGGMPRSLTATSHPNLHVFNTQSNPDVNGKMYDDTDSATTADRDVYVPELSLLGGGGGEVSSRSVGEAAANMDAVVALEDIRGDEIGNDTQRSGVWDSEKGFDLLLLSVTDREAHRKSVQASMSALQAKLRMCPKRAHARIELKDLSPFFGMTREELALKTGICLTVLKKLIRRVGITRWPCRKYRQWQRRVHFVVHKHKNRSLKVENADEAVAKYETLIEKLKSGFCTEIAGMMAV